MSDYRAASLDEIEGFDYRQDTRLQPVRHHLGITAFGTNAWSADKVGDRLFPEHEEDEGNEELYVVVRGRARFELGEETVDAPAGTLVFVLPETRRTAFAEEPGTAILAVGATQGKPYEPSGWEIWAPAHRLYETGDYAGAVEKGRALAAANPEYAAVIYNLACCEALAGMTEDAIGHLRAAIELRPSLRDLANGDTDLDPIRDEPGFRDLVSDPNPQAIKEDRA
jgi:mannose-6-phosphate isomerase-like protein (cupin superfamily)